MFLFLLKNVIPLHKNKKNKKSLPNDDFSLILWCL